MFTQVFKWPYVVTKSAGRLPTSCHEKYEKLQRYHRVCVVLPLGFVHLIQGICTLHAGRFDLVISRDNRQK